MTFIHTLIARKPARAAMGELFNRPRHKHETAADRDERRKDQREARLNRQQDDLTAREAALNERERRVRQRERAIVEEEASESSAVSGEGRPFLQQELGATAPSGMSDRQQRETVALVQRADALRRGSTPTEATLPKDPVARLIAEQAQLLETAPKKQRQPSDATADDPVLATMLSRSELLRRGCD